MTRQENTVPIFTYENEERELVRAERQQGAKRNPYLADYAGQGGGREDAAYVVPIDWRRERNDAGRSRSAGTDGYVRAGRPDSGESGYLDGRKGVDMSEGAEDSLGKDEGMRWRRPADGNGGMRAMRPMESNGGMYRQRPTEVEATRHSGRQAQPMPFTYANSYGKSDDSVHSNRRPVEAGGFAAVSSRQAVQNRPIAVSRRPAASSSRQAAQNRPGAPSGRQAAQNRSAAPSGRPGAPSGRQAAQNRSAVSSGRPAAANRKKRALMQRLAVSLWALGIFALALTLMFKDGRVSAAPNNQEDTRSVANMDENAPGASGRLVQGLPAEEFAKHPDWTENLLTPNEYSRPGEPLESVANIFVHYTANPGTSAAQNRSYFEQQKDTHENSVSSHFIIGYEGEIIQCVPLDEIAYAVATRNYDSVSIECCYLERDGSFTQETYDSLIALLAWLVDVYDLSPDDILRHYDCGGKKCPIYYTEHPGEWEQLKKDVDKL